MENDTVIQNRQKKIWSRDVWDNKLKDSADVIINYYVDLVEKFKARGGRVAFLRPPVTGEYLEHEPRLFPREQYWDRLLRESDSKGYHFMDYEETKDMVPPEWSHLTRKDADIYTRFIVQQLKKDQLL